MAIRKPRSSRSAPKASRLEMELHYSERGWRGVMSICAEIVKLGFMVTLIIGVVMTVTRK